MPAGMESAPPFSPGAEAPEGYAYGGIVRGAQMVGDKLGQYGSAANAALGRMFMNPQGITQPVLSGGAPTTIPYGNFGQTLVGRGNTVVKGGELLTPTFTEGVMQGTARLADQYPRIASAMLPVAAGLGLYNAPKGSGPSGPGTDMSSQIPRDTIEDKVANNVLNKPPILSMSLDKPFTTTRPDLVTITEGPRPAPTETPAFAPMAMEPVRPDEFGTLAEVDEGKKSTQNFIKDATKTKPLSKVERIKASQAEYGPLFEELLGSDKEAAKINALLLLSEAGLKLASSTKPTVAMSISESFANVPRGVAAIAAQERELALKTKTASLQQAISDVGAEDAAAAARQKVFLEGTMKMELEKFRNQGYIAKDGGAGLITYETKNGSRVGESLNPAYVDALKQNPIAVLFNDPEVNPFVRDVGAARTVVQRDPKQRNLLEEDLNQITTQLNIVRDMKAVVADAYSPGTFFTGVKNEYLVPLLPNAIVRPDLNKAQVTNTLKNGFSDLSRGRASQNGRLTNMQEQYNRDNDVAISKPDGLLQNPELAAKTLNTKETSLLNDWYNTATRLGVFDRDRVLSTPPTGTRNDPFLMPTDAASNAQMQSYLRSTFSTVRDPNAKIYIRDAATSKVYDLSIQNLLTPRPQ